MLGGNEPHGFTIVEITIFLAVSAIIFISVVSLVTQKQKPAYFLQGSRSFYSQIQSLATNVSNGSFNDSQKFGCTANANGAPMVTTGTGTLGTNYG